GDYTAMRRTQHLLMLLSVMAFLSLLTATSLGALTAVAFPAPESASAADARQDAGEKRDDSDQDSGQTPPATSTKPRVIIRLSRVESRHGFVEREDNEVIVI